MNLYKAYGRYKNCFHETNNAVLNIYFVLGYVIIFKIEKNI